MTKLKIHREDIFIVYADRRSLVDKAIIFSKAGDRYHTGKALAEAIFLSNQYGLNFPESVYNSLIAKATKNYAALQIKSAVTPTLHSLKTDLGPLSRKDMIAAFTKTLDEFLISKPKPE